jgi:hypothetical protein
MPSLLPLLQGRWGGGQELLQHAWPTAVDPGRGGGVEEGGGDTRWWWCTVADHLGCWNTSLLPTPPWLEGGGGCSVPGWGGVQCAGVVPGCDPSL